MFLIADAGPKVPLGMEIDGSGLQSKVCIMLQEIAAGQGTCSPQKHAATF